MNKEFRAKNEIPVDSLNVNYQGVQLFFDQDVLNLCNTPKGFLDTILSFIDSKRDERTYEKRIKNLIDFFKSILDYSFNALNRRNFNLDKIKKVFSFIQIRLPYKGQEDTVATYSNSNKNIEILIHDLNFNYNFSKPESLDTPGSEPRDYNSTVRYYSTNLIHEIGHAIHLNYLTQDAFDYWLEGWEGPYKFTIQSKKNNPFEDSTNISSKIRNEFDTNPDVLKKFKKENISNKLIEFQKKLKNLINSDQSIEKEEFLKKINFATEEDYLKAQKNMKTQMDYYKYSALYSSATDKIGLFSVIGDYLQKCYNTLKDNQDIEVLKFFESKEFNILNLEIKLSYVDSLSTFGLLYLLGLYSPDALFLHLNNLKNTTDENYQKLIQAFSIYRVNSPLQLQAFLTKDIIQDPFKAYSPEIRNNFKPGKYDMLDFNNINFKDVTDHLQIPTKYGRTNHKEDFAETFLYYILYPEFLSDIATFRMKKTLWLSGFFGKKIQEKLLRKMIQLMIESLQGRKSRPTSRFI
jgi:hypothetical protein